MSDYADLEEIQIIMKMRTRVFTIVIMMCFMALTAQAQVKVCMSYADFAADKWKPYEQLTDDKKPDSCRIKYDGVDFSIKTDDKEVNQIIKKEVFLM